MIKPLSPSGSTAILLLLLAIPLVAAPTRSPGPRFDKALLRHELQKSSSAVADQREGALDLLVMLDSTGMIITMLPGRDLAELVGDVTQALQRTRFTPPRRGKLTLPSWTLIRFTLAFSERDTLLRFDLRELAAGTGGPPEYLQEVFSRNHTIEIVKNRKIKRDTATGVELQATAFDSSGSLYQNRFGLPEQPPILDLRQLERLITYPDIAYHNNIEGKVEVRFMIEKTGKIFRLWINRSDSKLLDQAAMEGIRKLNDITPAFLKGKPVRSYIRALVTFRIIERYPRENYVGHQN